MTRNGRAGLGLLLGAVAALASPALARGGDEYVEAVMPSGPVPEEQLLDVAIDLFSPSIDDYDREELAEKGIKPSVRKSEARFIPVHLRNTLQSTGQWGVVRVVPGGAPWAEVSVFGKIETSNGKNLKIEVRAFDATGEKWIDERYDHEAGEVDYADQGGVDRLDPFQSLYNRIANDLVKARSKRKPHELARVREVADLRFAAEFAPETFGSYLESDKKGRFKALRLPADDDPMVRRLSLIRERDYLFVDTLNEYYSDFHDRMRKVYDDWRGYSYVEQVQLDSLNKSSLVKKIIGGIAIAAGVLAPDRSNSGIKDIAVIGGVLAIQSGAKDSEDSKIHKAALDELADSFESDVAPLLVDVDGKITQLTGSAEAQFTQWRELLRRIAHAEAALPGDINVVPMSTSVVVTPAVPPPVAPDLLPAPAPDPDVGEWNAPADDAGDDAPANPGGSEARSPSLVPGPAGPVAPLPRR